jgi:hypothetical protein
MVVIAVCDQKILVFVLQMEKSKKSTWLLYLEKRSHLFCQVRKGKKKQRAQLAQVESTDRESVLFFFSYF